MCLFGYVVHPINSWADRFGSFDLVTETGGMAHFGHYDGEYTCVVFERNLNEYSYDEACQGRSTIKTWDTAVLILVILDVPLRQPDNVCQDCSDRVLILVILDVPLRHYCRNCKPHKP